MPGTRESPCSGRWFQNAFGFVEGSYQATRDKFEFEDGWLQVKGDPSSKFWVGPFEVIALKDLCERVDKAGEFPADDRVAPGLTFRNLVAGTRDLHLEPDNEGSVFQVMSLFNCLTPSDPNKKPEDGITCYAADATQGPTCAISCPAASVFRNYYVHGEDELHRLHGQGGGKQLNCLAGIEEVIHNTRDGYWSMKNGYCIPKPPGKIAELGKRLQGDGILDHDVRNALRVGVHWDTEVASRTHRVCQVFCSTVPVSFTKIVKADDWFPLARALLDSAYDATLAVAALLAKQKGRRIKVFLTALGGGAEGNRKKWIKDSIDWALTKHAAEPLEVHLVHYNSSSGPFQQLEDTRPQPSRPARRTISEDLASIKHEVGDLGVRRSSRTGSDGGDRGVLRSPRTGFDVRPFALEDLDLDDESGLNSDTGQILKAFAYFDANGDGSIDTHEFRDTLRCLDRNLFTDEVIDDLIQQADADGDGDIYYSEFVTWLCGEASDSMVASRVLATAALNDVVRSQVFEPKTPAFNRSSK